MLSHRPIPIEEIILARQRMVGKILRTPLVRLYVEDAPAEIYLKLENLQKTGSFKATDAPQGVGRDYAFIGQVTSLKPGEMSKPFEGTRGFFIVKVLSKTAFDSTQYAGEKNTLRDQILQEKRNRMFSDWITALRDKADIEDNREKFFR